MIFCVENIDKNFSPTPNLLFMMYYICVENLEQEFIILNSERLLTFNPKIIMPNIFLHSLIL